MSNANKPVYCDLCGQPRGVANNYLEFMWQPVGKPLMKFGVSVVGRTENPAKRLRLCHDCAAKALAMCLKDWADKRENLVRIAEENEFKIAQKLINAEIQLAGWVRASNMLREGMGLDGTKTDLRECLLTFLELKKRAEKAEEALKAKS